MKLNLKGLAEIERRDMDTAVKTLTSAFSEDPCLKYLLDSEEYDHEKAAHVHQYTLELGLRYGAGFMTGAAAEGIIIWMPPKRTTTTTWMFLRAGGLGLGKNVDAGIIGRMKKYGDYASSIHHRHAPSSHWYLLSIGVAKEQQGKGHSGRLMKPMLEYFDANDQACFLETHNPKNVAFYEKHGFEVVEEGCLPDTNTTHWAMLRKPNKK